MNCPEPRTNRVGEAECPKCGLTWDWADVPDWCGASTERAVLPVRRQRASKSTPGKAAEELAKIRAILAFSRKTKT